MASPDETFMGIALAMARRGLGRTWPNPSVGAVIVIPGKKPVVAARGWTLPGGRPHAEVAALQRAGDRARGATLYVTLEPCAHHGRTPPCVDAIRKAGIARVVCGPSDPDPRVAGRGLDSLRESGIEVVTGVCAADAGRLARGHVLRVSAGRPEITLKLAVGSDGLMAPGDGSPVWVTGERARARGHLMRARSDAILVGRGTVEADDPELTCRLPGMNDRSPVRVVLDSGLRVSPGARIFDGAAEHPVWICCAGDAPDARRTQLEKAGAGIIETDRDQIGKLDPADVARQLSERGITRLLVEGGPSVARSFVEAGLVDRSIIFRAAAEVGKIGLKPFVSDGLEWLEETCEFSINISRPVGGDMMQVYEKKI